MSLLETVTEAISDNLRTLLIVAAGYAVAVHQGYAAAPTVPSLPEWWQLPAAVVASAVVVGWVIGGKIPKLLPTERHFVIAQEVRRARRRSLGAERSGRGSR